MAAHQSLNVNIFAAHHAFLYIYFVYFWLLIEYFWLIWFFLDVFEAEKEDIFIKFVSEILIFN